eukprot:TRINITY_DN19644_c0_g1_i1.p1 TRINITY_DN19644_c0_g1~~TRINITY_DN19644_c0_g1_i1.p1  ORF type:complete len:322 (+),score=37.99 TRINITY_DN19644_c0_g1_i1:130-1095(+)
MAAAHASRSMDACTWISAVVLLSTTYAVPFMWFSGWSIWFRTLLGIASVVAIFLWMMVRTFEISEREMAAIPDKEVILHEALPRAQGQPVIYGGSHKDQQEQCPRFEQQRTWPTSVERMRVTVEHVRSTIEVTTATVEPDGSDGGAFQEEKREEPPAAPNAYRAITVGALGGALTAGAGGGAIGLGAGGAIGAACGLVPAVFTFGLSIPFGALLGSGIGCGVGATCGAATGAFSGGAAGKAYANREAIKAGAGRLWNRLARRNGSVVVSEHCETSNDGPPSEATPSHKQVRRTTFPLAGRLRRVRQAQEAEIIGSVTSDRL